jgi:anti-sigma regulatory factor (Ser/Thr protein kinase)
MAPTATETTSLIAMTLPSTPHSVQMARFYVRAALNYHDLGEYAETAETITSELVTNAILHVGGKAIGLEVMHLGGSGAISVIVADSSRRPPVMRAPDEDFEHWRGLNIVATLSAHWGWTPQGTGKAVYAILAREA